MVPDNDTPDIRVLGNLTPQLMAEVVALTGEKPLPSILPGVRLHVPGYPELISFRPEWELTVEDRTVQLRAKMPLPAALEACPLETRLEVGRLIKRLTEPLPARSYIGEVVDVDGALMLVGEYGTLSKETVPYLTRESLELLTRSDGSGVEVLVGFKDEVSAYHQQALYSLLGGMPDCIADHALDCIETPAYAGTLRGALAEFMETDFQGCEDEPGGQLYDDNDPPDPRT